MRFIGFHLFQREVPSWLLVSGRKTGHGAYTFPSLSERSAFLTWFVGRKWMCTCGCVSISFREKCLPDADTGWPHFRGRKYGFHLFQREVPSWHSGKTTLKIFEKEKFPSLSERSAFLTCESAWSNFRGRHYSFHLFQREVPSWLHW